MCNKKFKTLRLLVLAMFVSVPNIASAEKNSVTFTVVSDSHICAGLTVGDQCGKESRRMEIRERLRSAALSAHTVGPDFIVHLGDHIEDLSSNIHRYINWVHEDFERVGSPFNMVLGNHDMRYYSKTILRPKKAKTNRSEARKRFQKRTKAHSYMHYIKTAGTLKTRHYDEKKGEWRFYGMNSGDSAKRISQGSRVRFSSDQVRDLRTFLSKSAEKNKKVVLFWHHGSLNDIEDIKKGSKSLAQYSYLKALCDNRNTVEAVFHGHTHRFKKYSFDCGDSKGKIVFYSVGSTGHPNTEPGKEDLWMHAKLTAGEPLEIINSDRICWSTAGCGKKSSSHYEE